MATEKRLIRLDDLMKFPIRIDHYDRENGNEHFVLGIESVLEYAENLPTVDAYTEEQVASIIQQADKLEARNDELEKEIAWLKSCLNCKIRKECPRHCGKVVHDCDHWEYGDSTVEVVRCKDCVSFVPESIAVCRHCALTGMQVLYEDDFCSYGERKENATV